MMLKKLAFINWRKAIIFIVVLLVMPDSLYAKADYSGFKINGFLMQSYVKTDKNNFLGDGSGVGSLDYREIGVNASVKISPKLQLASQLLSRYAGETDNGDVKLDFLLADYRMIDKEEYGFGLRVGRVKNPFGFYNETRDVSFTRENIVLPQSIYFERTRDVSLSADGVHIYGHKQTTLGGFNGQLAVGMPRVTNVNTEYALLGDSMPGRFSAKPSFVGRLKYESNNSHFIAAYSYVNMSMAYKPSASDAALFPNGDGEINFKMHIASLRYNLMKWSFMGEYAQRKINAVDIAYIPSVLNNKTGESFYLQSVYRLTHRWNVIARYDVLYVDKNDRDGTKLAQLAPIMDYSRYAKDKMLGIQFNVSRSWMLRLEVHTIDGTAWLPKQDNPDASLTQRKWNMLNASVSYRF